MGLRSRYLMSRVVRLARIVGRARDTVGVVQLLRDVAGIRGGSSAIGVESRLEVLLVLLLRRGDLLVLLVSRLWRVQRRRL